MSRTESKTDNLPYTEHAFVDKNEHGFSVIQRGKVEKHFHWSEDTAATDAAKHANYLNRIKGES